MEKVACANMLSWAGKKGFHFLKSFLAMVVVGILIAIIVPTCPPGQCRMQSMLEFDRLPPRSVGGEWIGPTRNLESQESGASCNLDNYLATLVGYVGDSNDTNWIAG